jgi:hypothetical protein
MPKKSRAAPREMSLTLLTTGHCVVHRVSEIPRGAARDFFPFFFLIPKRWRFWRDKTVVWRCKLVRREGNDAARYVTNDNAVWWDTTRETMRLGNANDSATLARVRRQRWNVLTDEAARRKWQRRMTKVAVQLDAVCSWETRMTFVPWMVRN